MSYFDVSWFRSAFPPISDDTPKCGDMLHLSRGLINLCIPRDSLQCDRRAEPGRTGVGRNCGRRAVRGRPAVVADRRHQFGGLHGRPCRNGRSPRRHRLQLRSSFEPPREQYRISDHRQNRPPPRRQPSNQSVS